MPYKSNEQDIEKMNGALLHHMKLWASIETSMSMLLHAILHLKNENSHVPLVVYFSPNGFDARMKLVKVALEKFIEENPACNILTEHWKMVWKQLLNAKEKRNVIAHGAPIIMSYFRDETKMTVLQCPPIFHIKLVGDVIKAGGTPGMTVDQVLSANTDAMKLVKCIQGARDVISDFHHEPGSLHQTIPELVSRLQAFQKNQNPQNQKDDQTQEAPSPLPESSGE